jgi:hypothetical protein
MIDARVYAGAAKVKKRVDTRRGHVYDAAYPPQCKRRLCAQHARCRRRPLGHEGRTILALRKLHRPPAGVPAFRRCARTQSAPHAQPHRLTRVLSAGRREGSCFVSAASLYHICGMASCHPPYNCASTQDVSKNNLLREKTCEDRRARRRPPPIRLVWQSAQAGQPTSVLRLLGLPPVQRPQTDTESVPAPHKRSSLGPGEQAWGTLARGEALALSLIMRHCYAGGRGPRVAFNILRADGHGVVPPVLVVVVARRLSAAARRPCGYGFAWAAVAGLAPGLSLSTSGWSLSASSARG